MDSGIDKLQISRGRRASPLKFTHVPDPLTLRNFVHLYSGEAGLFGYANRATVLRRDLQDDPSRLRGAAKIFGHEVDGTPGESRVLAMGGNPIRDIDRRRITKKLQVRFDKTDQLIVTAIEDTEGATRAAGALLLFKLVDGGLHRGSRAASTAEPFRHLLILAG